MEPPQSGRVGFRKRFIINHNVTLVVNYHCGSVQNFTVDPYPAGGYPPFSLSTGA
jgi:hypothetical protein